MITLSPMHAGGPYDMQIDAGNHITIKNILIGDVWVCSGQSNMELPMERVKDKYPAIIAAANNVNIRQFNVSTSYNFHAPQKTCHQVTGRQQHLNLFCILLLLDIFLQKLYMKNIMWRLA
jgi:hypothetical protein